MRWRRSRLMPSSATYFWICFVLSPACLGPNAHDQSESKSEAEAESQAQSESQSQYFWIGFVLSPLAVPVHFGDSGTRLCLLGLIWVWRWSVLGSTRDVSTALRIAFVGWQSMPVPHIA
eukprot:3941433-Rhodomonas_salina.3